MAIKTNNWRNNMAEIVPLSSELQEKLRPALEEYFFDSNPVELINSILQEGVFTCPEGIDLVTLNIPDYPALQFRVDTGEFIELTDWDYIQTVDVEAQKAEAKEKEELEGLITILTHYLRWDLRICCDFETVIKNRKTLTVGGVTVYEYPCPGQTIYLKEDNYPITYGRQRVKGNRYQYNFRDEEGDPSVSDDLYTDVARYEWKRNSIFDE